VTVNFGKADFKLADGRVIKAGRSRIEYAGQARVYGRPCRSRASRAASA